MLILSHAHLSPIHHCWPLLRVSEVKSINARNQECLFVSLATPHTLELHSIAPSFSLTIHHLASIAHSYTQKGSSQDRLQGRMEPSPEPEPALEHEYSAEDDWKIDTSAYSDSEEESLDADELWVRLIGGLAFCLEPQPR